LSAGGEPMVITPEWPAPARVRCAFTLRSGGVSVAPHDSLNVGAHVGDAVEAVGENRRRVRDYLRLPAEPVWLQQVHGIDVVDLDGLEGPPGADTEVGTARGDAVVTRVGGCVCVIQVADCMPVLFAARDGSVVGASHAGWRGLAGGVLERTVQTSGMRPAELIAWLGPTISQQHFEVGDDVRTAFVSGDSGATTAFTSNTRGRWQCDLYALARRRLAALGVSDVFGGEWCTYADAVKFFSFRRDGHCGRMAALIWLE
jgi:polyphenol oxidase